MKINDVTFDHEDFVNFARMVGYGITDPLTVFHKEGDFKDADHAKALKNRLLYFMEGINAKPTQLLPHEQVLYRTAESFLFRTEQFIFDKHSQQCVGLVNSLINNMTGYHPLTSDGKTELMVVKRLLLAYHLMKEDEHDNLIPEA